MRQEPRDVHARLPLDNLIGLFYPRLTTRKTAAPAGNRSPVLGYRGSATVSLLGFVAVAPVPTGIGAVTALIPRVAPKLGIVQYRAVGERDLIQTPRGQARFSGVDIDGYYITGREGSLAPAYELQRLRTGCFGGPMYDLALVILHIEFNQAVRIGPREFRNRGLLEFGYLVLVRGISVMC